MALHLAVHRDAGGERHRGPHGVPGRERCDAQNTLHMVWCLIMFVGLPLERPQTHPSLHACTQACTTPSSTTCLRSATRRWRGPAARRRGTTWRTPTRSVATHAAYVSNLYSQLAPKRTHPCIDHHTLSCELSVGRRSTASIGRTLAPRCRSSTRTASTCRRSVSPFRRQSYSYVYVMII